MPRALSALCPAYPGAPANADPPPQTARPFVQVQLAAGKTPKVLALPAVLTAPIRLDVVQAVHASMNKNRRQAFSVNVDAGMKPAAESWGTGRAVARVPRVGGGGTSRSGQGAFANMCRGGRMFAPTKTWRRWHRRINTNQRRFALASALAASALPSVVLARGHRIGAVAEVPLVVSADQVKSVTKTSAAAALLKKLNAYEDVEKSKATKKLRRGVGKMRNRRYVQRRGPLVVYDATKDQVSQGFRNLPGVDLCEVTRLNLLQLAPGGHVGRFVIWTEAAFAKLDAIYGNATRASSKVDYHLPRALLANPDITRIINSDEIQSKLRPAKKQIVQRHLKKNPLTNFGALVKLNPYAKTLRRRELAAQEARKKKKQALLAQRRQAAAAKGKSKPAAKKPAAKPKAKKPKIVKKQKDLRKAGKKFSKLLLSA